MPFQWPTKLALDIIAIAGKTNDYYDKLFRSNLRWFLLVGMVWIGWDGMGLDWIGLDGGH